MADIVSKITVPNVGTYAIRSGYIYRAFAVGSGTTSYVYSAELKDSLGNTVTIPSYESGMIILVNFRTAPYSGANTIDLNVNNKGPRPLYYGPSGTVKPNNKIFDESEYLVVFDGTYFRIVNSIIGENIVSSTSIGTSNATSATSNASTYINHVEGGSVTSSIQVIGNGAASVSAYNGVLTISATGGGNSGVNVLGSTSLSTTAPSSYVDDPYINHVENGSVTSSIHIVGESNAEVYGKNDTLSIRGSDEMLKVGTYVAPDRKQVVMHNGHGTIGTGYGSDYFTYNQSIPQSNTAGCTLYIGNETIEKTPSTIYEGRVYLAVGCGTNVNASGSLLRPTENQGTIENRLPYLNGTIISSGGCASGFIQSVYLGTGILANTQYQQCYYSDGNLYAPVGSGGGGGTHYVGENVLTISTLGTTNAASTTNSSTYLNHVENGTVTSSVQIIGTNSALVSGTNGVLSVSASGSTLDPMDYRTLGAFCGLLNGSDVIGVQPARIDSYTDGVSDFTRQGVIRPFIETVGVIPSYHTLNVDNRYNNADTTAFDSFMSNGIIATGINFADSGGGFIAIPVIVDYYFNEYTRRYESVPYIMLPSSLFEDIRAFYETSDDIGEGLDDIDSQDRSGGLTNIPDDVITTDVLDGRLQQQI